MKIKLGPFLMLCVTVSVVLMYVGRFLFSLPKLFWDGFCNVVFFGNAPVPAWGGHGRPEYNAGARFGAIVVVAALICLVVFTAFFISEQKPTKTK